MALRFDNASTHNCRLQAILIKIIEVYISNTLPMRKEQLHVCCCNTFYGSKITHICIRFKSD